MEQKLTCEAIALSLSSSAAGAQLGRGRRRSMEDVKEGKDYNFPTEETEVLRLWDEIDAFKEQLRRTEGQKKYSFYDGPPFATGLPHYGHLLAGTIKAPARLHCLARSALLETCLT